MWNKVCGLKSVAANYILASCHCESLLHQFISYKHTALKTAQLPRDSSVAVSQIQRQIPKGRVSEKRTYDESPELDSSGPTASDTHIHVYGKNFPAGALYKLGSYIF